MQNENFVSYYKSIVSNNETNLKLPPGLPIPPQAKGVARIGPGHDGGEGKKSHRKSSHKRRRT